MVLNTATTAGKQPQTIHAWTALTGFHSNFIYKTISGLDLPTLPLMQEWEHIRQRWLSDGGVHLPPGSRTQFQTLSTRTTSGNLLTSPCSRILIFKMERGNITYLEALLWESKPCWQMLRTVTGTHQYTINSSCLHHDPRHHHLCTLTDRTVSMAEDNGHECALQREGIFHGSAQICNDIPSTHSPLTKCQGRGFSHPLPLFSLLLATLGPNDSTRACLFRDFWVSLRNRSHIPIRIPTRIPTLHLNTAV